MALILSLSTLSALAETLDLSQMTFEELAELQTRIDLEMQNRPKAEEIVLSNGGTFIVGRDL